VPAVPFNAINYMDRSFSSTRLIHIARIKHQKVEGWMEAMTMEFPVRDETEFHALHTGDQIEATVFVQDTDFWIGEIHSELVK
jgi:Cu/Ag efflux protein CusF